MSTAAALATSSVASAAIPADSTEENAVSAAASEAVTSATADVKASWLQRTNNAALDLVSNKISWLEIKNDDSALATVAKAVASLVSMVFQVPIKLASVAWNALANCFTSKTEESGASSAVSSAVEPADTAASDSVHTDSSASE